MSAQNQAAWPGTVRRRKVHRRTSVRFMPTQEIVCHCGSNVTAEWTPARVCDISAGGACLLLRHPVEVDDWISVEMINGSHTFFCARDLRVLRVFTGASQDTVVAGEFDRPLNYEELLPFIV